MPEPWISLHSYTLQRYTLKMLNYAFLRNTCIKIQSLIKAGQPRPALASQIHNLKLALEDSPRLSPDTQKLVDATYAMIQKMTL